MAFDALTYTAPACWAPCLINGDESGLDDDDATAATAWAESLPGPIVSVHCDDDDESPGFLTWHDARAWAPWAADCGAYVVLVERGRPD